MGGGTYRQVCESCVSSERMGDEALAKKLSNLDDEIFVIIVACPRAGKHDTASKKQGRQIRG